MKRKKKGNDAQAGRPRHKAPQIHLEFTADDTVPREEFGIGEPLTVQASGLQSCRTYDLKVGANGKELFSSRLMTDSTGGLNPTVLWSQVGLFDPSSSDRWTIEEAVKRWKGKSLSVGLMLKGRPILERSLRIIGPAKSGLVLVTDAEGRLLNGFEVGKQPLILALALPFNGAARIFMVARQHDWRQGDSFRPAIYRNGEPAVLDVDLRAGSKAKLIQFAAAKALLPGAYDFVVRPLHYGHEENDRLHLQPGDVVGARRTTGLVVRENFWLAKPVLGGCVNKIPLSGRYLPNQPYFQYADSFQVGEDVWAAMDPGIVDPGNISKICALYVVSTKTQSQWNADNSLTHLAILGGNPAVHKILLQSGCINHNRVLVWPAASLPGEYDIVADFGNNVASATSFVQDDHYDTPLDVIDGYFTPGFRVVEDPGVFTEFANAGNWNYDENVVTALGLQGMVTVQDESGAYHTPGGFSALSRNVLMKAHVFFPADVAGVTDPAMISATKPNYPLVVIVPGNGHNYTSYDFLLQHFARNGFIAASIDCRYLSGTALVHGMNGLGRANVFFQHMTVLKAKFGATVQNNIGIMGHSRGGEAVLKIARLNQQLTLNHNINAVVSLAPTDQYGSEVLAGAWSKPYLVIYGSRDGDVAGQPPYAGYTVPQTGFSLYDRAGGSNKSMVFVYQATHNGFITANSDNPSDSPLPVTTEQTFPQADMNAFFRQYLIGEMRWEGIFKGEWKPASVATTGAVYYLQYQDTARRTIDDMEGGVPNWQASTIGASVSHGGTLPVDPSEGRLHDQTGSPGLDPKSPHDSNGMQFRWDNNTDSLVFDIPAGQRNVSNFLAISFRATQKADSPSNPLNQGQNLRVALKDSANNERAIRVSPFGSIPFPDQRSNASLVKSALTTVRIPLKAFSIVCAGLVPVNLTDVVSLSFKFSEVPTGEIAIDDIEFTN